MNPDVAAAVDRLGGEGVVRPEVVSLLRRTARGELVSVRPELRLLLYGGVLVFMAGVGLLVRENLDRIGPVAIASALLIGAAGALLWSLSHAPPFSWGKAASTNLAFDYILLLGVLLTGAALAYIEAQFTALGPSWRHHLVIMTLIAGALAVRCDSRMVASIALSTFAAWRGVAASPLDRAYWFVNGTGGPLRVSVITTGLIFVVLGYVLTRTNRKAHFEPVAMHLGWFLILCALVSGLEDVAYRLALFAVGTGLAAVAFWARRFPLFAMGLIAGYIGLSALFLTAVPHAEELAYLWFMGTGAAVLVGLLVGNRLMQAKA